MARLAVISKCVGVPSGTIDNEPTLEPSVFIQNGNSSLLGEDSDQTVLSLGKVEASLSAPTFAAGPF